MNCKKSMATFLALAVAANSTGLPVRAEGKSFLERIEALEKANWTMASWRNALNNLGDLPDDIDELDEFLLQDQYFNGNLTLAEKVLGEPKRDVAKNEGYNETLLAQEFPGYEADVCMSDEVVHDYQQQVAELLDGSWLDLVDGTDLMLHIKDGRVFDCADLLPDDLCRDLISTLTKEGREAADKKFRDGLIALGVTFVILFIWKVSFDKGLANSNKQGGSKPGPDSDSDSGPGGGKGNQDAQKRKQLKQKRLQLNNKCFALQACDQKNDLLARIATVDVERGNIAAVERTLNEIEQEVNALAASQSAKALIVEQPINEAEEAAKALESKKQQILDVLNQLHVIYNKLDTDGQNEKAEELWKKLNVITDDTTKDQFVAEIVDVNTADEILAKLQNLLNEVSPEEVKEEPKEEQQEKSEEEEPSEADALLAAKNALNDKVNAIQELIDSLEDKGNLQNRLDELRQTINNAQAEGELNGVDGQLNALETDAQQAMQAQNEAEEERQRNEAEALENAKGTGNEKLKILNDAMAEAKGKGGVALTGAMNLSKELADLLAAPNATAEEINKAANKVDSVVDALNNAVKEVKPENKSSTFLPPPKGKFTTVEELGLGPKPLENPSPAEGPKPITANGHPQVIMVNGVPSQGIIMVERQNAVNELQALVNKAQGNGGIKLEAVQRKLNELKNNESEFVPRDYLPFMVDLNKELERIAVEEVERKLQKGRQEALLVKKDELSGQANRLQWQINFLSRDYKGNLQKRLNELKQAITNAKDEVNLNDVGGRLNTLENDIQKEKAAQQKAEEESQKQKKAECQTEIDKLQKLIDEAETQGVNVIKAKSVLKIAKAAVDGNEQLATIQGQISSLKIEINSLTDQIAVAKEKKDAVDVLNNLNRLITEAGDENSRALENAKTVQNKLKSLLSSLTATNRQIRGARDEAAIAITALIEARDKHSVVYWTKNADQYKRFINDLKSKPKRKAEERLDKVNKALEAANDGAGNVGTLVEQLAAVENQIKSQEDSDQSKNNCSPLMEYFNAVKAEMERLIAAHTALNAAKGDSNLIQQMLDKVKRFIAAHNNADDKMGQELERIKAELENLLKALKEKPAEVKKQKKDDDDKDKDKDADPMTGDEHQNNTQQNNTQQDETNRDTPKDNVDNTNNNDNIIEARETLSTGNEPKSEKSTSRKYVDCLFTRENLGIALGAGVAATASGFPGTAPLLGAGAIITNTVKCARQDKANAQRPVLKLKSWETKQREKAYAEVMEELQFRRDKEAHVLGDEFLRRHDIVLY